MATSTPFLLLAIGSPEYDNNVFLGDDRFRRGLQRLQGMPRCRVPRKSNCKTIVANDDNYALAA